MCQCSVPVRLDFDRPLWETLWFDPQLLAGWKCNSAQKEAGCHGAFHRGEVLSDPGAGGLVSAHAAGEETMLVGSDFTAAETEEKRDRLPCAIKGNSDLLHFTLHLRIICGDMTLKFPAHLQLFT